MSLRVFLARTHNGWEVMSGGFARIGKEPSASAIAMQSGGSAADVWIVGTRKLAMDTLLHQSESPFFKSQSGALPSRAADNLFWLGRYVERAEGAVRLLRAYHARLLETADPDAQLVARTAEYLEDIGVAPESPIPEGLCSMLQSAVNSAGKVRDRFSVDGWLALNDLAQTANGARRVMKDDADVPRAMSLLLRKITGFSGLVHENMYRFTGWRFLSIGRALERANRMADLLSVFTGPDAPDGALELLLEVGDSAMSMSRRYAVSLSHATVLDLLAMDPKNPRSVMYQLDRHEGTYRCLAGRIGKRLPLRPRPCGSAGSHQPRRRDARDFDTGSPGRTQGSDCFPVGGAVRCLYPLAYGTTVQTTDLRMHRALRREPRNHLRLCQPGEFWPAFAASRSGLDPRRATARLVKRQAVSWPDGNVGTERTFSAIR